MELPMTEYFKRREPTQPVDYEQAYWGTVTDPDGHVRDRLKEREKHLEDVAAELKYLNGLPGGRLLDVGCGLGFFLSGLGDQWQKHGLEVSSFAAKHAKEWGEIFIGTLEQAKYPDAHFDAVVMHHVIEHLDDPISAIGEVRRILKPGGALVLGTPDFDSGCARRFGEHYRLLHDPTHVSLFTNESMHRFLRDHGFVINHVEYPYFETRYFSEDNLKRLFKTDETSPPFYGNFMTFYATRPVAGDVYASLMELSQLARRVASTMEPLVKKSAEIMATCLQSGGKILACGNGGSAADAQHFIAELVGHLERERPSLPGITLTVDPSNMTAIGNDYGWEFVFSRQVEGLGKPGDVLLGMSTSGKSKNVLNAFEAARKKGIKTIALVGEGGDPSLEECDVCIHVPTRSTQRIQEIHTALLHAMCAGAEESFIT